MLNDVIQVGVIMRYCWTWCTLHTYRSNAHTTPPLASLVEWCRIQYTSYKYEDMQGSAGGNATINILQIVTLYRFSLLCIMHYPLLWLYVANKQLQLILSDVFNMKLSLTNNLNIHTKCATMKHIYIDSIYIVHYTRTCLLLLLYLSSDEYHQIHMNMPKNLYLRAIVRTH